MIRPHRPGRIIERPCAVHDGRKRDRRGCHLQGLSAGQQGRGDHDSISPIISIACDFYARQKRRLGNMGSIADRFLSDAPGLGKERVTDPINLSENDSAVLAQHATTMFFPHFVGDAGAR